MFKRLMPYFNAEGLEGGGAPTFEINGQQMTAEQVADAYKKLQADHTKISQKNSDLSKQVDQVKPWVDWDQYLNQFGPEAKQEVGKLMDTFVKGLESGKAPTNAQMSQLGKAIDKAEAKGDDELAQRLQALESTAMEVHFEKVMGEIEKTAQSEGVDFDRGEFQNFSDQWLDDLGLEEFEDRHLKKAYQAYEAQKLKESAKKGNIPPLGTSGGAAGPDKGSAQPGKVGGLRGAAQKAAQLLK